MKIPCGLTVFNVTRYELSEIFCGFASINRRGTFLFLKFRLLSDLYFQEIVMKTEDLISDGFEDG